VLPLVPGYLSAVSAVEVDRLGERGVARRIAVASLPFILGFTAVFVVLGAGAAAIGSVVDPNRRNEIAGFVLVLLGLAFMGLLPWPERALAPSLLTGARKRGSAALLGGAFAVCAAPCIGTVLASILVLASDTRTVLRGSLLLAVYSAGLGIPFLIAAFMVEQFSSLFAKMKRHLASVERAMGVLMIVTGIGFLTGAVSNVSIWLLETFPALQSFG